MTNDELEKIRTVANRLIAKLDQLGVVAVNAQKVSICLAHVKWMLQECQNKKWDYGKANRWLAWSQCVLHIEEIIDGEQERNETREIFKGA